MYDKEEDKFREGAAKVAEQEHGWFEVKSEEEVPEEEELVGTDA